MTNQELFDKCLTHLRQQGQRSVNESGECMYRAPDGGMCAIGALIPDEKYDPNFENRSAAHNPVWQATDLTEDQLPLALTIQRQMHDMAFGDFRTELEIRAHQVAAEFGLCYTT